MRVRSALAARPSWRNSGHCDAQHGERGAGRLTAIVWLAILVAFAFVCVKVLPVLLHEYQFQDAMNNAARFAAVNRQTPEDVTKSLLLEASQDDLPIRAEDIKVTANNGNVKIQANCSITLDLALYQWTLNFHPSAAD